MIIQCLLSLLWGQWKFCVSLVQPQYYAGHMYLHVNVGDSLYVTGSLFFGSQILHFICGGSCVGNSLVLPTEEEDL